MTGPRPRVVTEAFAGEGELGRRLFPDLLTHAMTPIAEEPGVEMQIVAGTDEEALRVEGLLEGAPYLPAITPMTRNFTIRAKSVDTERRIWVTVVGVQITDRPIRSRTTM